MKKLLSLVLATTMLATTLVACSGKPTTSVDPAKDPVSAESKAAEGGKKIVYWSMWESTEAQGKAIQAAVDAYTKKTGNTVDLQFKGRTGIREGLQPALDANTAIDMFDEDVDRVNGTWGKYLMDLEELAKGADYEKTAMPGLVKAARDAAGGKLKSIPYQPFVFNFFSNAAILDKAGVKEAPKTWADFDKACAAIKKSGVTPITCDDAYITAMFGYHMSRLVGEAETTRIVKEKDWANPAVLSFAKAYEDFAKKGYFSKTIESNVFPAGQNQELAVGTAAMYLNGSWLPNEVKDIAGADFKWGCFAYPTLEGGKTGPEAANFGSQVLAINAKSEVSKEAFELMMMITKGEFDKQMSVESLGIPADTTNTEWPAQLAAAKPVFDAVTTRYTWAAGAEANGDVTPIIKSNTLKLCSGKITAAQFVENLKAGK